VVPESIPIVRLSPFPAMGSGVGMGVGHCCLGAGHGITSGIGRRGGTWEYGIMGSIGKFRLPHS